MGQAQEAGEAQEAGASWDNRSATMPTAGAGTANKRVWCLQGAGMDMCRGQQHRGVAMIWQIEE